MYVLHIPTRPVTKRRLPRQEIPSPHLARAPRCLGSSLQFGSSSQGRTLSVTSLYYYWNCLESLLQVLSGWFCFPPSPLPTDAVVVSVLSSALRHCLSSSAESPSFPCLGNMLLSPSCQGWCLARVQFFLALWQCVAGSDHLLTRPDHKTSFD